MNHTPDFLAALQRTLDAAQAANEVRKKNAPTATENRRRRGHNAKHEKTRKTGFAPLPLPYRLPEKQAAVMDAETQAVRALRKRTPKDWKKQIMRLAPSVRVPVAYIVWWDFFAQRMPAERWDHLDKLIDAPWVDAPPVVVEKALHALGYTPYLAVRRLRGAATYGEGEK